MVTTALFMFMGEILLFQMLVVTQESECCYGNASQIMMCTHYIFITSLGNVSGKPVRKMRVSNLLKKNHVSYFNCLNTCCMFSIVFER
jgi:hypothetical protein